MSSASSDMDRSKDLSANLTLDYGAEDKKYDSYTETPESKSVDDPTFTTDSSYTVNCTVSIALAILKEHEEYISEKKNKGTKNESSSEVVEAPSAEGYYCIEYNMLPDDPEPTRVDLVMFGLAAKLYMANETKVLKPWREGNKVWVSWSQTLKLNVTRELLIKLASHKITVRVWDSKDKVSFKARNDKPKAFRLPKDKSDPDQMGGIKKMVCEMRAIHEKEKLRIKKSKNNCGHPESVPIKCDLKDNSQMVPTKKTLFPEIAEHKEIKQEKESASLELSFAPLLAGSMTLTDSLGLCSGGVKEGFWTVTLDQQLLSEELKVELNPLVIRVLSACSLPSLPAKAKCLPAYCQYKFHNMPIHRTKGHDHSTNICFRDVNVIFTGLMSCGKMFEFLRGPPVEIEVHDRDRNNEKPFSKPAVFGTDPNDATVDLWTKVLKAYTKPHYPYGIAKLDLSDLLQGCRHLRQTLPIHCSSSKQNEIPSDTAMPVGNYIETGSQLKVLVELACPLHPEDTKGYEDCPFGRIIYVFRRSNTPILTKLTSEILTINANAFQLNHYPVETIQRVLSGQKICIKETEEKRLNVLTGFHLMDKALHLFVLEGLKDQAVKRLWTTVHMKLDGDEEEQVTVLYNSDLSFSERLYDLLDLRLSPICLLKPLETITKEPLVFIRNAVPHACLEAIKRISHIRRAKRLQEAVHYNLFPSADMVVSLNKQFGLDNTRREQCLPAKTQESRDIPEHHNIRKKTYTPLDNFNREYLQRKQNEGKNVKDFIQANIEDVHSASNDLQKSKPYTFLDNATKGQTINYDNIDTNSTTPCGKQLYRELSKDSTRFFYPGFKSSIESNKHPKLPDDARIEELRKPWRENVLHGNKLKPTLSRSRLPSSQRHQDFELYARPPLQFGPELPLSIHLAGDALRDEQLQAAHAQYSRWMRRILLGETSTRRGRVPEFRCHMKGASLDKLQDILKDKPMKHSLKKPGMALKPIPPISVVQFFETTGSPEEEANIPFAPGPFQNHSLSLDKNTIPRYSSQYNKFHFRDYQRPHSFLYKRSVLPFTDDEKSLHSSQKPAEAPQTPVTSAHFKHNRNITEIRTNKDITLNMH